MAVGLSLDFYYIATAPPSPVPSLGRIYPVFNHGDVVFVTHFQDLLWKLLLRVGVLVMFASGLLVGWLEGRLPWQTARRGPQLRHPK